MAVLEFKHRTCWGFANAFEIAVMVDTHQVLIKTVNLNIVLCFLSFPEEERVVFKAKGYPVNILAVVMRFINRIVHAVGVIITDHQRAGMPSDISMHPLRRFESAGFVSAPVSLAQLGCKIRCHICHPITSVLCPHLSKSFPCRSGSRCC